MPNKLHLAHRPSDSPLCGRKLSSHRLERAQDQASMRAMSWALFSAAPSKKQCRWCLREAGLLQIEVGLQATIVELDNDDFDEGEE